MKTEAQISVPTDNLYKFVAIFATVLIPTLLVVIFGVISTFSEEYEVEELWKAVAKSEYDEASMQTPPPPVLIDGDRVRPSPNAIANTEPEEDAEADQGLLCFAWVVRGLLGTIVFLMGAALLGFLLWYTRLQRFRDRLIRTEALSSEHAFKMMMSGKGQS